MYPDDEQDNQGVSVGPYNYGSASAGFFNSPSKLAPDFYRNVHASMRPQSGISPEEQAKAEAARQSLQTDKQTDSEIKYHSIPEPTPQPTQSTNVSKTHSLQNPVTPDKIPPMASTENVHNNPNNGNGDVFDAVSINGVWQVPGTSLRRDHNQPTPANDINHDADAPVNGTASSADNEPVINPYNQILQDASIGIRGRTLSPDKLSELVGRARKVLNETKIFGQPAEKYLVGLASGAITRTMVRAAIASTGAGAAGAIAVGALGGVASSTGREVWQQRKISKEQSQSMREYLRSTVLGNTDIDRQNRKRLGQAVLVGAVSGAAGGLLGDLLHSTDLLNQGIEATKNAASTAYSVIDTPHSATTALLDSIHAPSLTPLGEAVGSVKENLTSKVSNTVDSIKPDLSHVRVTLPFSIGTEQAKQLADGVVRTLNLQHIGGVTDYLKQKGYEYYDMYQQTQPFQHNAAEAINSIHLPTDIKLPDQVNQLLSNLDPNHHTGTGYTLGHGPLSGNQAYDSGYSLGHGPLSDDHISHVNSQTADAGYTLGHGPLSGDHVSHLTGQNAEYSHLSTTATEVTSTPDILVMHPGDNPWNLSEHYLTQVLGRKPTMGETYRFTYEFCSKNGISVPEWGLIKGMNEHAIPAGHKLIIDQVLKNYALSLKK